MQRVLEKMAKKLNEYDEASLMMLWQNYAEQVHDFEPTKRWEEAAIAFCLIQAVHWKNQLFNYHLALQAAPPDKNLQPPTPDFFTKQNAPQQDSAQAEQHRPKATILQFSSRIRCRCATTSTLEELIVDETYVEQLPENPAHSDPSGTLPGSEPHDA